MGNFSEIEDGENTNQLKPETVFDGQQFKPLAKNRIKITIYGWTRL